MVHLCNIHQDNVKAHHCDDARCLFYMHFPGSFNDLFISGAPHVFDAILDHLDHEGRVKARQVCKQWREIIDKTHRLWKTSGTPLHACAGLNLNLYAQHLLANGAELEATMPRLEEDDVMESATPLLVAAYYGNVEMLRTLIQAGGDVNASLPWYPVTVQSVLI